MPTERNASDAERLRDRRILRLAAGTALCLWVSQAVGWTLSYVAPIITLVVLALPMGRPPPKFLAFLVGAVVASVYGSFALLPLLLNYRLAGLIVLAVVLFHVFYMTARGKPAVLGTLLTIGITLTVAVGSVSVDGLIVAAHSVTAGVIVGAAFAWLAHLLLPDPPFGTAAPQPPVTAAEQPERLALRSLAVVFPVSVWFLLSPASASLIPVMIKVAAMGQEATAQRTRQAARSLLVSTATGGIAAVLAWHILGIWPSLTLYTLLVGIAALWFGARIFAGTGLAADGDTWSYALLTMIVVLAPAVLDSQFGSAAPVGFYTRLFMLLGASLYGVLAVFVFDRLWPSRARLGESLAGTA